MKFTKEDIDNLRILADALCQMTTLEPNEEATINKFYQFLEEQEKSL